MNTPRNTRSVRRRLVRSPPYNSGDDKADSEVETVINDILPWDGTAVYNNV